MKLGWGAAVTRDSQSQRCFLVTPVPPELLGITETQSPQHQFCMLSVHNL